MDPIFLRLNLLFLMAIAFLPFPTRLMAEFLERSTSWQRMAAVVYGLTLLVIRLLGGALSGYSRRGHLRLAGPDDADDQEAQRKFGFAIAAYAVTIGLSFVVPIVAILIYFAIGVVLVVPLHAILGVLFPRTGELVELTGRPSGVLCAELGDVARQRRSAAGALHVVPGPEPDEGGPRDALGEDPAVLGGHGLSGPRTPPASAGRSSRSSA